jgi:hypothetical protein
MGRDASAILLGALLSLCACKPDGKASPPPPPPPPPPPMAANFNVDPCLVQVVAPGQTVAILVVPDTLTLDFNRPSVYPNGRHPRDPVIDYTLAFLFLDLTRHPITTLHSARLNPPTNDKPLPQDFPYLAAPHGTQRVPAGGSNFNFRTDPSSAYVRVDRMGMPAIATAVISSAQKVPYNDDSPAQDSSFKWVPEIRSVLTGLTNALADDFDRLNLTKCAKPA